MDFSSPAFIADPYPVYRQLREAGPLYALAPGLWLATRYGVADALLRDGCFGKDYLSGVVRRYGPELAAHPLFATVNRFMLLMNPPAHTRLRALVSKAFSAKQAGELRRLAQAEAQRLLAGFAGAGRADLVAAFAYPLPVAVIQALLDIDEGMAFQRDSLALVKVFELAPLSESELQAAWEAAQRFDGFFRTVYINLGAANRDPAVFTDPEAFDIRRAAKPLSFGGGAHYCLGARLARIELETALAALLQGLPGLRLEGLDAPRWRPTNTVRGLECLWAEWNPFADNGISGKGSRQPRVIP